MSKRRKMRKPRPSAPPWWFYVYDNCCLCPHKNGCNNCKLLKEFSVEQKKKRDRIFKQKMKDIIY